MNYMYVYGIQLITYFRKTSIIDPPGQHNPVYNVKPGFVEGKYIHTQCDQLLKHLQMYGILCSKFDKS